MAKIAFILLCHKDPKAIIDQAQQLTAAGDYIAIHFDARARREDYKKIQNALVANKNVTFAKKRIKCGWGEWSLVRATLNAIEAACEAFPLASHFYMLSGDCMAIKSARYLHQFLDDRDVDYIESFDFIGSGWIKTGMREDRLIYRHFFNERANKWLFYTSMEWQKRLGLSRSIPSDLKIHIGSQWWCLRRRTIESVLDFSKNRKDVRRFFSTTWIPDETYFQTLVGQLIPSAEIETRSLTFFVFSEYGLPATFYNDHYDFLVGQDYLFARKISSEAKQLKDKLNTLYMSEKADFEVTNDGKKLYNFLTHSGRRGQRFAPRIWDQANKIGPDRTLLVLLCKKRDVAKRLMRALKASLEIPALGYLFDEDTAGLPKLGNLLSSTSKKNRHRPLLTRLLFEYHQSNHLIICLDPSDIVLLKELSANHKTIRILEISCLFDDQHLLDYAENLGLINVIAKNELTERILLSIRNQIAQENEAIEQSNFNNRFILSETASDAENSQQLMAFCDLDQSEAARIIEQKWIFSD